MELGPLGRAVHECDEFLFFDEWEKVRSSGDAKAQAQEALLVSLSVSSTSVAHYKSDVFRRIVRHLLDEADPNARTPQGEAMLYLAVKCSAPGKVVTGELSEQGRSITAGHKVLCRVEAVQHPQFGSLWMEGEVLDATQSCIRVHFTFQQTMQLTDPAGDAGDGQAACNVIRDKAPPPKALTPGLSILMRIPHAAGEHQDVDVALRRNTRRASDSGVLRKVAPFVWVSATLTSYSMKGGYDVTTADGEVYHSVSDANIRILKRASTASELVNPSLVLKGQHVRVTQTGDSRGTWDGVVTGKSEDGYGVLCIADGKYESDVPEGALFLPEVPAVEGGGGIALLQEMLCRDVNINDTKALPMACHRNNLNAVRLMLNHSRRGYLGLHAVAERRGLRVAHIHKKSPASECLEVGDIITSIAGTPLVKTHKGTAVRRTSAAFALAAGAVTKSLRSPKRRVQAQHYAMALGLSPDYRMYLSEDLGPTVLVILRGTVTLQVSVMPVRYKLNSSEHYMRQSCLDLTQDEDIALLLVKDGVRLNVSQAAQRCWERATSAALDPDRLHDLDEDTVSFVNERHEGRYALEAWCAVGHLGMAQLLLHHKADPNSCSLGLGRTPLYSACCCPTYSARLFLIRLLLKHGAKAAGTRCLVGFLSTCSRLWQPSKLPMLMPDLQDCTEGGKHAWRPCIILSKARSPGDVMSDSDAIAKEVSADLPPPGAAPALYSVATLASGGTPNGETHMVSDLIPARYFEGQEVLLQDGRCAVVLKEAQCSESVEVKTDDGHVHVEQLWNIKDVAAGVATLAACRILTGDPDVVGASEAPVSLAERQNKGNCFELVTCEQSALYLMERREAQQNAHKQHEVEMHSVTRSNATAERRSKGRECVPPYVLPMYAAANGWLQVIEKLSTISEPPVDWNELGGDGLSAVGQAIASGRHDMLQALLHCGARADSTCGKGQHVLLLAAETCVDPVPFVVSLLDSDPALSGIDTGALAYSVKRGHIETVATLLRRGASTPSRFDRLLSHEWACSEPSSVHEDILQLLIQHGEEPCVADLARCGYMASIKQMVEKSPESLSDTDSRGNTALMNACVKEDTAMFEAILNYCDIPTTSAHIDLNTTNDEARSVLFLASQVQDDVARVTMVQLLLRQPSLTVKRSAALPRAASLGQKDVVQLLLADPSRCSGHEVYNEKTALQHAVSQVRTGSDIAALLCVLSDLYICLADLACHGQALFSAVEVALHHQTDFDIDDVDDDFGRTALAWVCSCRADSAPLCSSSQSALLSQPDPTLQCWVELGVFESIQDLPPVAPSTESITRLRSKNESLDIPTVQLMRCDSISSLSGPVLLRGMTVLYKVPEASSLSCLPQETPAGVLYVAGLLVADVSPSPEQRVWRVRLSPYLSKESATEEVTAGIDDLFVLRNKTVHLAEALLRRGADIDALDSVGKSVVHLAVEYGNISMARFLISRGADIHGGAMYASAHRGDLPLMQTLLQEGVGVLDCWLGKYPGSAARTLQVAEVVVRELLALDLPASDVPDDAIPSLALCARHGWVELTRLILEKYPDLIRRRLRGARVTPAEAACKNGHLAILELLVAAGAKLNITNDLGEGLLFIACRAGHADLAEFLVKHPQVGLVGSRALAVTSSCEHYDITEVLLRHSTAEERAAAAAEEFFGKDVFRGAQSEDGALKVIHLLPDCVTDHHLLHFAVRGWEKAVSASLQCLKTNASCTTEGLWKVCNEVTRLLVKRPPLALLISTPGKLQAGESCIVVDHESKSKAHATIAEVCTEGQTPTQALGGVRVVVEYAQTLRRSEVFACQLCREEDRQSCERGRDALWGILKEVLVFCSAAPHIAADAVLREIGTSHPAQRLYAALRNVCLRGLMYFFEGLEAGLSFASSKLFETLQFFVLRQLCLPSESRVSFHNLCSEERLHYFRVLARTVYVNGVEGETPLDLACESGWGEAVTALMHSQETAFAHCNEEPGSVSLVCERVREISSSIPADDVSLQSHQPILQLASIAETLIEKGSYINALDVDLLCLLRAFNAKVLAACPALRQGLDNIGDDVVDLHFDSAAQPSEEDLVGPEARWNVQVTRYHKIESVHETTVRHFTRTMELGIFHLAAHQGNEESIRYLLEAADCSGCSECDNDYSGCLPRDYAQSTVSHNLLLEGERKIGRLPAISDIDLVLCVEDNVLEFDMMLLLRNVLFGCCTEKPPDEDRELGSLPDDGQDPLTQPPRKQKMSAKEIVKAIEGLGVGAFLWEPYTDASYVICNASLHRLEVESRRSLVAFSEGTDERDGLPEFSSASRQALVENILNTHSGDMARWRCQCGHVQCDREGLTCTKCRSSSRDVSFSSVWLDDLRASGSIRMTFGVHDHDERESLWKRWKFEPFSSLHAFLLEPEADPRGTPEGERYNQALVIESYLGSKIAFYFLFVCFYIAWLVPLSVTGVFFTAWQGISGVDNSVTVGNCFVVIGWASVFTSRWQRKASEFAYFFGTRDHEELAIPRSEFMLNKGGFDTYLHPVTTMTEPRFGYWQRLPRRLLTGFLTLLMISIVGVVMVANFRLRKYLDPEGDNLAGQILAGVENAVSVILLDAGYLHVVELFIDWENHRTNEDHQSAHIMKTFIFQFVNAFSGLILTAIYDTPGELLTQLAALMFIQSLKSQAQEKFIVACLVLVRNPTIRSRLRSLLGGGGEERKKRKGSTYEFDERERAMLSDSQKPNLDKKWLFDDMTMVCLQFSYVICFASVLPLAPVIALLAISLELRTDLFKYLFLGQRASPSRASGIGNYLAILNIVTYLAAPINAVVVFSKGSATRRAWREHTYLEDVFTSSHPQIASAITLMSALVFVKFLANNLSTNALWVRNAVSHAKFKKKKQDEGEVQERPPTTNESDGLETHKIQVLPSPSLEGPLFT